MSCGICCVKNPFVSEIRADEVKGAAQDGALAVVVNICVPNLQLPPVQQYRLLNSMRTSYPTPTLAPLKKTRQHKAQTSHQPFTSNFMA